MRILHVLSQYEVTGAEVYAAVLSRRQHDLGHTIFIVSDTLSVPAPGTYIPHPIGVRSYPQRLRSIKFLVQLIRREGISIIHAHSRAASWVCFFASMLTGVPLVSTIHGRQHVHASLRLFNVYGRYIIAVSKSLSEHLIHDLRIPSQWVTKIPNGLGISTERESPAHAADGSRSSPSPGTSVLLFVGRLTGPKGDVVRSLIKDVMPAILNSVSCTLRIVGGQIVPPDIPQLVRSANESYGREVVTLEGFRCDLRPIFASADMVIGSGRVAMEAMLAGVPALAFGESGYLGPITSSTVESAAESNFGDTGTSLPFEKGVVVSDILRILREGPNRLDCVRLQAFVRTHYDIKLVERKVANVYQRAHSPAPMQKPIPVLMYHRVVQEIPVGSRHGIWVTADRFEAQLRSLRDRGYTAMTLRQYRSCMDGEEAFPPRPVLLTFDDGYEDNFANAFPLLQKYGYPAVVFLVADFSDRTNFWDREEPVVPLLKSSQIQEMDRGGIEFGSHTLSHPHLSRVSSGQLHEELASSKKAIEDITGREVLSLAYPYGDLNGEVKSGLAEAGYAFGVATDSGPLSLQEDLHEIRRIPVFPGTDSFGFWKKTHPWYSRYRRALGK